MGLPVAHALIIIPAAPPICKLSTATMPYDVEEEVSLLIGHIKRLSTDGESVTFKMLFDDDGVANSLESLAGTLKAAKRKGKVSYGPELLLQGMSDSVVISLTGK